MTRLPTWPELVQLMALTLSNPREGAATALNDMPVREAVWLMFGLVIVLTVMVGEVASLAVGGPQLSVLNLVSLQTGAFLLMTTLLYHVGRVFGGHGSFEGALMLVTWLQFIFIFVQIIQVLTFMILPFTAAAIALLSVVLFLWLLVHFAAELHGFTSTPAVVAGVFGTFIATGIALWGVASILGIQFQTGLPQ